MTGETHGVGDPQGTQGGEPQLVHLTLPTVPSLLTINIKNTLGHIATATSLTCKSEPYAPPPPLHPKASRRWIYIIL